MRFRPRDPEFGFMPTLLATLTQRESPWAKRAHTVARIRRKAAGG